MPVQPNYLALQTGPEYPGTTVIAAFRQHFHGSTNVGGTEQELVEQWGIFKCNLINAVLKSVQSKEAIPLDEMHRANIAFNIGGQVDVRAPLVQVVNNSYYFPSFTDIPRIFTPCFWK